MTLIQCHRLDGCTGGRAKLEITQSLQWKMKCGLYSLTFLRHCRHNSNLVLGKKNTRCQLTDFIMYAACLGKPGASLHWAFKQCGGSDSTSKEVAYYEE